MGQLGLQGSPATRAAEDYTSSVLSGKYLNANPWLDKTYGRAASRLGEEYNRIAMRDLESRFAAAGRTGGGARRHAIATAQDKLGDQLEDLATSIYGGDYARERGAMTALAPQAPGIAAGRYQGAQAALGAGREEEAYSQRLLDELIRRFSFQQDEPTMRLERYRAGVGAPVQTTRSTADSSQGSGFWSFFV